jgi:pimeloyl-ACP methyl ester carboxylesterase
MPACVIWGERDTMVPRAHGDAYVAGLPGADRLSLVADAGHAAPLEQPDQTAAIVMQFLAKSSMSSA